MHDAYAAIMIDPLKQDVDDKVEKPHKKAKDAYILYIGQATNYSGFESRVKRRKC